MLTLPMLLILQPIPLSPVLIPIRRSLACCSFRCCCCASMCIGRYVDCEGRGNSWLRQPCNGITTWTVASHHHSSHHHHHHRQAPPSHTYFLFDAVCLSICVPTCLPLLLAALIIFGIRILKKCAHAFPYYIDAIIVSLVHSALLHCAQWREHVYGINFNKYL